MALAGLTLVHATISAAGDLSAIDPMSWAVDTTLLLTAFFVAWPMLKLRRSPRAVAMAERDQAPVAAPD